MKKRAFLFTMIFAVVLALVQAGIKPLTELPQKYKIWLDEEVVYIISTVEKDVFLQLETDIHRDLFIESFWKHRDPTPGTPENEYKIEHYRRIKYANYNLGREVAKPGWMTDRGRIYIILGKPRDIESFSGQAEIYDTEVWYYSGLTEFGLPPVLHLVFFQRGGAGEYVFYHPASDGPQALMTTYMGGHADYINAYLVLSNIAPTLAKVSLSLVPGDGSVFSRGRPSLESELIIPKIYEVPKKKVRDKYAERFLHYKDIIEVDYSANYIDNDSLVKVLKHPSGRYFVHYALELMTFSVQQHEGKYSTFLKINGNITDLDGKTVYQYEKPFSFKLDETQFKNITYRPFDLYDMFPLLPGKYKFSLILKNEISKEFTSFEENIIIPEDHSFPYMGPLILSYKIDQAPHELKANKPFKIGLYQIYSQPKQIFSRKDKLFLVFQILGLPSNLKQNGQLKYEFFKKDMPFFSQIKKVNEYQDQMNFKEQFSLEDFLPDYYRIRVTLLEGNKELFFEEENFMITPMSALPRPWVHSKTLPPSDSPVYASIFGKQYYNKGEINLAQPFIEEAYHRNPNSLENATNLAKVYFAQKDFRRIKEILPAFTESANPSYTILTLLGKSYHALGEFSNAIALYDKAISHFGVSVNLLNLMGECYSRLGIVDEALAAWEKSLEINPNQVEIMKKMEDIKKRNLQRLDSFSDLET